MFEAPTIWDAVFALAGLSAVVMLPFFLRRWWLERKKRVKTKREFFRTGKSLGLAEEETALLWKCAKSSKEPLSLFQNRQMFEECMGKLVREDTSYAEAVASLRRRLGFEDLPWFLPLRNSRDIQLYQTGFVASENTAYSSVVWEKNEVELHVALLEASTTFIRPGDRVKFSFLREDDGRYYFQSQVLRTYRDGNRLVLVLSHVEELSKIQLRGSQRWRVKLPCKLRLSAKEEQAVEGTVEDISLHGLRVCVQRYLQVQVGERVFVSFGLGSCHMEVAGIVRHVKSSTEKTCFGMKFEEVDSEQQECIRAFILDKQRELLKAYGADQLRGGFSS